MTRDRFEAAYVLQRFGRRSDKLARYLHTLGDAQGSVLAALTPRHGLSIRQCLYRTTNVLEFWAQYSTILRGDGLKRYAEAVHEARKLWKALMREPAERSDSYMRFLEGPLLMHEHLIARYAMSEAVYALYDQAGQVQYDRPERFRYLLNAASKQLLGHLSDFKPIERFLAAGHRSLGFDVSTVNRLCETKVKMQELAALLSHFARSHRPLPAFKQLYNVFLSTWHSQWYAHREHEWAAEIPRYRRFSLVGAVRPTAELSTRIIPDATKEKPG